MHEAPDHLTAAAQRAVESATKEATEEGVKFINSGHLLLGLLSEDNTHADQILKKLDVDVLNLDFAVVCALKGGLRQAGQPSFTSDVLAIFESAYVKAQELGHTNAGTGHILLSMLLRPHSYGTTFLQSFGVSYDLAAKAAQELGLVAQKEP